MLRLSTEKSENMGGESRGVGRNKEPEDDQ